MEGIKMKRIILLFLLALSPELSQAADDPDVVIVNENTSEAMCVQRATNVCINSECLNSDELDCSQQCQKDAEDACEAQTE